MYLHGLDAHGEPTRFVAVNDAACRVLGYTREELLGLTPRAIDASPEPGQLRRIMQRLLRRSASCTRPCAETRDGGDVPVEISSSLTDVDGELLVLSISRDITGRKETERRLGTLTLHDELTGLLNRRGFYVMLPEQRKRAKRTGAGCSLLYGDVDGFKTSTTALGHARRRGPASGRRRACATRSARPTSWRASAATSSAWCAEAAGGGSGRARARASTQPSRPRERSSGLELSLSHGTVVTDWRGLTDPDELLTRADMLMYEAKRERRRPAVDAGRQTVRGTSARCGGRAG